MHDLKCVNARVSPSRQGSIGRTAVMVVRACLADWYRPARDETSTDCPLVQALGCVPALPGYLKAMKSVCRRHGVLFILDEIMCGMGRTGSLHAWKAENVVPDIQVIGKGLAGGYADISGLLCSSEIFDAFGQGKTAFNHGHTFQNSPRNCAAALAVQKVIREEGLLQNAREMGDLLSQKLKTRLLPHRYIGDIRGKGLFWGVRVSQDKNYRHTDRRRSNLLATR